MKCTTCFSSDCDCVVVEDRLAEYLNRGGVRALYQLILAEQRWLVGRLVRNHESLNPDLTSRRDR